MTTRMIRVTVEVPEEVGDEAKAVAEAKAHEAAVLALWQAGKVSTRRAAEELGLTYYDFLDLLAAKGIPVVNGGDIHTEAIEAAQRKLAGDRP
jgi:predicted HTH domain antitoxin